MSYNNIIAAKPVTCKRCGHDACAWNTSKNGKYYLVNIFEKDHRTDYLVASQTPHDCNEPDKRDMAAIKQTYFFRKANREQWSQERYEKETAKV